jgi:S1-C subfamily serine protease
MSMTTKRIHLTAFAVFAIAFLMAGYGTTTARAEDADLQKVVALQQELQDLIAKTMPAYLKIGGGTGSIISEDGYFITNYHVAVEAFRQSETTTVTLANGNHYVARRVGWDPVGDLTLCKMDLKEGEKVPFFELGDSDAASIGQLVLIYGNPFSLSNDSKPTISFGVISAKNRYISMANLGSAFLYVDALQTDAALNPGNSGGPMISLDGKLLGINGLIFTRFGFKASTGLGFAVSANQIKTYVPLLKKNDVVYHGTIGGIIFDTPPDNPAGAHIQMVQDGSAAAQWGFKTGDLVVKVNDAPVPNAARFLMMITKCPEQTEFKVTVMRDGKEVVVSGKTERIPWQPMIPGLELPPQQQQKQDADRPVLGVVFDDQYAGNGAKIKAVTPNTGAAKAGIAADDIITKIDGNIMANFTAVIDYIKSKKGGDTTKVTFLRNNQEFTVDVLLMKFSELQPAPPQPQPAPQPGPAPAPSPAPPPGMP